MTNINNQILLACQKVQLGNENEAATRLKVIDRILREVLGWSDDDITPEEHVSEDGKTSYADYVLRTANAAIVVEAKKGDANFEVSQKIRKQKLSTSFVSGSLGEAILQARDYARKLGIDFAVVTNGDMWVLFPAQRHDQVKFNDSYAIVFPNLTSALKDDFHEFVGLLSRDSVIAGSIELAVIGRSENQFGDRKLGRAFAPTHRAIGRNPIFPLIEDAVRKAFSDSIEDLEGEFLEKCYVSSPESTKFDKRINLHLTKRDHLFSTSPIRPMKQVDSDVMRQKLAESISKVKPLAVLLLGTVGSGKTTFLQYTRKVKAKNLFEKTTSKAYPHWIYIDLRKCTDQSEALSYVYEKLRDYVISDGYFKDYNRCVRRAYENEIEALKSGPLFLISKDKDKFDKAITDMLTADYTKIVPYIDKLLSYAARESAIFLVVDNVDQFEKEEDQSKLFAEAIALGHKLGINLVMSMRGSTFVKHRNSPLIDAYDFDPIQIDPPIIASVLSKRFALTKQLLNGEKGQFTAENGVTVKLENVADIVDLVQASVLGSEVGNRIEVLATEDVRLALRMTREFLEYGYSNFGKAWEIYRRDGAYMLPKHEAFRAILLGNRTVYSEETSPIANPFDSGLSINSAQLLRLYILTAIVNLASDPSFRHIDGSLIAENLRKIGFGDIVILSVLKDLCQHRFLHTTSQNSADIHSSFIPSRLGGYIVRDLLAYFPFVENVLFDTFIPDDAVWEKLRQLSYQIEQQRNTVERVKLRIERVKVFFDFMSKLYLPLQAESQKRNLPSEWCSNPFEDIRVKMQEEILRVERSSIKNYGQDNNKMTVTDEEEI